MKQNALFAGTQPVEAFTRDAYNHKIKVGDSIVYIHETIQNCFVRCIVVAVDADNEEVVLQDPKHPDAMYKTMPATAVVKIANE